jgi:hypothetical protein
MPAHMPGTIDRLPIGALVTCYGRNRACYGRNPSVDRNPDAGRAAILIVVEKLARNQCAI